MSARFARSMRRHESAAADAVDVEQIVDEANDLRKLALHHCASAIDDVWSGAGQAHHLQPIAQRRQRIAQLVRQRGEEFILAAIGLLQRAVRRVEFSRAGGDTSLEIVVRFAQRRGRLLAFGDVVHRDDGAQMPACCRRKTTDRWHRPFASCRAWAR